MYTYKMRTWKQHLQYVGTVYTVYIQVESADIHLNQRYYPHLFPGLQGIILFFKPASHASVLDVWLCL